MKFWTIYWCNGKKQFIAGATREQAYRANNINQLNALDVESIVEGFDFKLYWSDIPPKWNKNSHPINQIDLHRVVVNGDRFETDEVTFNNKLLAQSGAVVRRFNGRLMVFPSDLARIWRLKLAPKEHA